MFKLLFSQLFKTKQQSIPSRQILVLPVKQNIKFSIYNFFKQKPRLLNKYLIYTDKGLKINKRLHPEETFPCSVIQDPTKQRSRSRRNKKTNKKVFISSYRVYISRVVGHVSTLR